MDTVVAESDVKWTEFSFILKPAPTGGVGVFATHDIPRGTHIFSGNFSQRKMKIKAIPIELLKYVIYLNDEECMCPERFDQMEIGWYLNHSDQPNIAKDTDGRVIAIRAIKKGDEILVDYNQLNEPEHLKEPYYKK